MAELGRMGVGQIYLSNISLWLMLFPPKVLHLSDMIIRSSSVGAIRQVMIIPWFGSGSMLAILEYASG